MTFVEVRALPVASRQSYECNANAQNDIDGALEFVRRCRDEVVQLPLVSRAQTIVLWDLSDVLFVRDHALRIACTRTGGPLDHNE